LIACKVKFDAHRVIRLGLNLGGAQAASNYNANTFFDPFGQPVAAAASATSFDPFGKGVCIHLLLFILS
jgi:hypothetical protein